jgi:Integrase core domain
MSHMFDLRCDENGIDHRLTKACPRGGGDQAPLDQRSEPAPAKAGVERMNRTIKEGEEAQPIRGMGENRTVKRYHYDNHKQLEAHLHDFIDAYNYGRRLKTLKGLTPFEYICKIWTIEPERYTLNPTHQMPRLNT